MPFFHQREQNLICLTHADTFLGLLEMGQAQGVVVNWVTPDWWPGTSGVPQGPVLSNIFINNMDAEMEGIDDIKLRGAVNSHEGREDLQRDLNKLQGWAITHHTK